MSESSPEQRRLIPEHKVGTITYTQRDVLRRVGISASARLGEAPTLGHLGGADFPGDPTDLGERVALPGGWRELFEFLAAAGFRQVEFAGYGQNPANAAGDVPQIAPGNTYDPRTKQAYLAYARTLRGFLDESGLVAIGSHSFIPDTWPGPGSANGAMTPADYDRFQTELEFASILGMPYMGTADDPTSAEDRAIEPWTLAGEKWEALNRLSLEWAIHLYPHNHAPAYDFLQDGPEVLQRVDRLTGAPLPAPVAIRGESGKRLMQHWLDITDPDLCIAELDVYWAHVARHRHRWRFDWNGNRVEDVFDPLEQVASHSGRYALFHAKDGRRTAEPVGVGDGYSMLPFGDPASAIDFRALFATNAPDDFRNPNYEQDDAAGGDADPGRSLRLSRISAANMHALRD
jgi:sugar phosphate isomerase/epimerase